MLKKSEKPLIHFFFHSRSVWLITDWYWLFSTILVTKKNGMNLNVWERMKQKVIERFNWENCFHRTRLAERLIKRTHLAIESSLATHSNAICWNTQTINNQYLIETVCACMSVFNRFNFNRKSICAIQFYLLSWRSWFTLVQLQKKQVYNASSTFT